ncbi:hypothetical protein F441_10716 [Phytophthora nicotianae CJ01A1]|uniref:RxLR effector protein n=6 Tax=Phytophthora nicotianae TaxID=4792 RepID=W2Q464_PHYN3|nr:hypothetical protein PPTG_12457 [Phytophthora nicotianae INRA-310]ETK84523.1 hypothetical protein L915_10533 [Phytophthora nicotianae]ETO59092.1 hypothetical protein F444_22548 [Phytophthora nicotianae P1976]ETP14362.1 hypothetical protein F441_10716 [Phytophthora nicotianae CJ01A1]ETP42416.1 hypothetical protein F442_10687 [Phytophthora nicotianae P10297]KUF78989.1 hypothetical protein AM587_10003406 [Phytophthora nicotianae]
MKLLLVLLLLALVAIRGVDGRTSNLEGTQVYRQASSRPKVSEVVFTNEEESLLRGQQSDTARMLAARLPGKTSLDVQKRCIQLGLRCGGDFKTPERNSENRLSSRRHQV